MCIENGHCKHWCARTHETHAAYLLRHLSMTYMLLHCNGYSRIRSAGGGITGCTSTLLEVWSTTLPVCGVALHRQCCKEHSPHRLHTGNAASASIYSAIYHHSMHCTGAQSRISHLSAHEVSYHLEAATHWYLLQHLRGSMLARQYLILTACQGSAACHWPCHIFS